MTSTQFSTTDHPTLTVNGSCDVACESADYRIDGQEWKTVPLDASGDFSAAADSSSPPIAIGSHVLVIQYLGNSSFAPSSLNSIALTGTGSTQTSSTIYNFNLELQPNGNVSAFTDSVNGSWSNIVYDNLTRLAAATQELSSQRPQYFCWVYDALGNRKSQTVASTACLGTTLPDQAWYDANNRLTGTTLIPNGYANLYDAAGNLLFDGSNHYLCDDEGRVCATQSVSLISASISLFTQYIYDAEGRRVAKGTASSLTCDLSSFSPTHSYVLDQEGNQLTETDGTGNWLHSNLSRVVN